MEHLNFAALCLLSPCAPLLPSFLRAVAEGHSHGIPPAFSPDDPQCLETLTPPVVEGKSWHPYWLTFAPDCSQFLGSAGLWGDGVGGAIVAPWRGRGLGTKMLALVLARARELGLRAVYTTCSRTNPGSQRVVVKNGGVPIGTRIRPQDGALLERYRLATDASF